MNELCNLFLTLLFEDLVIMTINRITREALIARENGIIDLIGFLFIRFSLKIVIISFLLIFITDYVFHYKIMYSPEIIKSLWNAASSSILIGLIPVVLFGVYIEYIYPEEK